MTGASLQREESFRTVAESGDAFALFGGLVGARYRRVFEDALSLYLRFCV